MPWLSRRPKAHDLDVKSRVHPIYKKKYHVGNWPAYDRALVQRGDVTLWLAPEAITTWTAAGVGKRGVQPVRDPFALSKLGRDAARMIWSVPAPFTRWNRSRSVIAVSIVKSEYGVVAP